MLKIYHHFNKILGKVDKDLVKVDLMKHLKVKNKVKVWDKVKDLTEKINFIKRKEEKKMDMEKRKEIKVEVDIKIDYLNTLNL